MDDDKSLINKTVLNALKKESAFIHQKMHKGSRPSFLDQVMPGSAPTKVKYARGENKDHARSYEVEVGKTPGVYYVFLYRVLDLGVEQNFYKVTLSNPPHPSHDDASDINAWDVSVRSSHPGRVTYTNNGDIQHLPLPDRETLGMAFDVICAHWFFHGQ